MRIWQQMSRLFGILWRRLLLSLDDDQWRMMPLMDELPAAVVNSRPTNFNANKKSQKKKSDCEADTKEEMNEKSKGRKRRA